MRTISKPVKKKGAGQRRVLRSAGQLTVRNVPSAVDRALRRKAAAEHRSLNDVLVEALGGGGVLAPRYDDLDSLAGRWEDDSGFDAAMVAQDQIDESLWR